MSNGSRGNISTRSCPGSKQNPIASFVDYAKITRNVWSKKKMHKSTKWRRMFYSHLAPQRIQFPQIFVMFLEINFEHLRRGPMLKLTCRGELGGEDEGVEAGFGDGGGLGLSEHIPVLGICPDFDYQPHLVPSINMFEDSVRGFLAPQLPGDVLAHETDLSSCTRSLRPLCSASFALILLRQLYSSKTADLPRKTTLFYRIIASLLCFCSPYRLVGAERQQKKGEMFCGMIFYL